MNNPCQPRRRSVPTIAIGIGAALLLTACGSSGSSGGSAKKQTSTTDPVLTSSAAAKVVVDQVAASAELHKLLPSNIASKGSINDYINIPYQPMEMYATGTKNEVGFDVDLAKAVGKVLGVKVNFTNVQFPALLTSLSSGRADIVMSGASDIPERRKLYDFVDYFGTGDVLAVTKSDKTKHNIDNGMASMCGLTVVTGQGTSFVADANTLSGIYCTSKGKSAIKQIQAQSVAEAMVDVQTGRAQGFLDEGPEALDWYIKSNPGTPWTSSGPVYFPNDYGAILKKGNPLLPAIQAAMKQLKQDGTYQKLGAAYGIDNGLLDEIAVNSGPCECKDDLIKE